MDQTPFDKARQWYRVHPKISLIGIEILFLALALICYHGYFLHNRMQWAVDPIFHWNRISEISHDINHGIWPQFDMFTGYRGIALPTFYPWLTFLPFALFRIMRFPPIVIMGLIPVLTMMMGCNISFFAFKTCKRSNLWALFYALLYNMSFIMTSLWIVQGEYAAYISFSIAPLAFIGWYHWITKGHYEMMLTGLILMMGTHLVSTIILVICLGILTLMCCTKLTWKKVRTGLIALGIFTLVTALIWVPIVVLMKTSDIWHPELRLSMRANTYFFMNSIGSFSGGIQVLYDFQVIIAILIGIFRWKQLGYYCHRFYILMILLWLFNSPFLPWDALQKTFIGYIQFPYRVVFVLRLCAAFICIKGFQLHFEQKDRILRTICIGFIVGLVCYFSAVTQTELLQRFQHNIMPLNNIAGRQYTYVTKYKRTKNVVAISHHKRHGKYRAVTLRIDLGRPGITNREFNTKQLANYTGQLDYVPKNYIRTAHSRRATASRRKLKSVISGSWSRNGVLHFRVHKHLNKMRLPVVLYKGQKYQYKLNHKPVHLMAHNNEPVMKNVHKGAYTFTFKTPIMWYRWLSLMMTILGLGLLISVSYRHSKIRYTLKSNRK